MLERKLKWYNIKYFSPEVVAVEDFIDVGNILGKSWVSLSINIDILG